MGIRGIVTTTHDEIKKIIGDVHLLWTHRLRFKRALLRMPFFEFHSYATPWTKSNDDTPDVYRAHPRSSDSVPEGRGGFECSAPFPSRGVFPREDRMKITYYFRLKNNQWLTQYRRVTIGFKRTQQIYGGRVNFYLRNCIGSYAIFQQGIR